MTADSGGVGRPPGGILAWLLRRPVHLYQLGLGWILASRFAEITHRGRKTRRIYRSVVEVVRVRRSHP